MALIPRKPTYPLPSLEEKRWKELGGEFGKELNSYMTKLVTRMVQSYDDVYQAFLKAWHPKYSYANVSNPPLDAELDAIFGTPSMVGAGFTGIVNDAGGGANEYFVWSDGTYWWYATGTKAA